MAKPAMPGLTLSVHRVDRKGAKPDELDFLLDTEPTFSQRDTTTWCTASFASESDPVRASRHLRQLAKKLPREIFHASRGHFGMFEADGSQPVDVRLAVRRIEPEHSRKRRPPAERR
jgi:hypothetical protein